MARDDIFEDVRPSRRLARLRKKVHDELDVLWMADDPVCNRVTAYRAMARVLGLAEHECHVKLFDMELCERALSNMERIHAEAATDDRDQREFSRLSKPEIHALRVAQRGYQLGAGEARGHKDARRIERAARKLAKKTYLIEHPRDPDTLVLTARGRHALAFVASRNTRHTRD